MAKRHIIADVTLRLRITLVDPPDGAMFALQRGKRDLEQGARATGGPLSFEFDARARTSGTTVTLLGPHCQGPPASRFVYVNAGTLAGDAASCWTRRAKVPLTGITAAMVARASQEGTLLEARIAGTGRDGGPAAASVLLLDGGWKVVRIAKPGSRA